MLELRSADGLGILNGLDEAKFIHGYASVFNAPADLGEFYEIVRPGAFRNSLQSGHNIRALYDHDSSALLGTTRAGTLSLKEDHTGLAFSIEIPNTSYGKDILALVKRGDIAGCSFGFRVKDDNWQAGDKFTRELLDVELHEITLTANPAYPQTSAALRSLDAMVKNSGDDRLRALWMNTL